jgi:phosphate transport system permease protein
MLPWLLGAAAVSLVVLLGAVAVVLLHESRLGTDTVVIYGLAATIVASSLGLVIALPVAFGVAAFVTEFAPTRLSRLVGVALDVAAVIPAVVFGLWGFFVLAPIVAGVGGPPSGQSLLSASIVLAVMLVPYVAALTRDLFASVPAHQREAAMAVGATRWEVMTKLVLPQVRLGLLGAVALGLARAFGETVAIMLVIGHPSTTSLSLFEPATTAAVTIARELSPDVPVAHSSALVAVAGCLFAVTAGVLAAGHVLVARVTERGGTA